MKTGKFVSVWDSGEKVIVTNCKFDIEKNLIEDVQQYGGSDLDSCESLDREYVLDEDDNEFEVCTDCHEHFLETEMQESQINSTLLEEVSVCKYCRGNGQEGISND